MQRRATPQLVLLVLLFAVLTTLVTSNHYFQGRSLAVNERAARITRNIERVRLYDEVLTGSARLAAATGGAAYERRYHETAPRLDAVIADTLRLADSAKATAAIASISDANQDLISMEERSFELGRRGDGRAALALLDAPGYRQRKQVYAQGSQRAEDVFRSVVRRDTEQVRRYRPLALGIGILGGAMLLVACVAILRLARERERAALERATLDGLTELPNQSAFQRDLEHAGALAARHGEELALALLDIDDFKFLNDRHGHRHGDDLLLRAASVLRGGRVSDRVYRVGGDEFAVVLPRTDAVGGAIAVERIQRQFADAHIAISIGLSVLAPGRDVATLREEADAAMYDAKRRGGNAVVCFEEIRDSVAITTTVKMQALRQLLVEQELEMAFQPIWDLERGALVGVEALARPSQGYGFSGPAEAFDIAEQIGRVHELDRLCVDRALARVAELPEDSLLFINISPRTLDLDADSDSWLVAAVMRSGIDPGRVVIEVTERFGGRIASIVKSLQRLRAAGLRLALDDVGTGNSGLEMLRQVNAEFVKIDRSVVVGAMTEPGSRAVLLAVAAFANESGAFVIAEGIEDVDMLTFLQRLEYDMTAGRPRIHGGQGYGLGRPDQTIPATGSDLLLATLPRLEPLRLSR